MPAAMRLRLSRSPKVRMPIVAIEHGSKVRGRFRAADVPFCAALLDRTIAPLDQAVHEAALSS
jgi:hypothetical protein